MFRRFLLSIKFASKSLRHNVGRTALTLVGVVVGIMSVIVVSSSGQGVKNYILGQFDSYGSNLIQIEPKVPSTGKTSSANATGQAQGIQITTLKISDAEVLKKIPNVDDYVAGTIGQEIFSYRGNNKSTMIYGVGANWLNVDTATKVAQGVFYTQAEDDSLDQVIVIGQDIRDELFGSEDPIGKSVKVKGSNYRVIGVLEKRGTVTFVNYDELVYMPVQTLQKKILGVDYLKFISVLVKDSNFIDVTAADINDTMKRLHKTYKADQEDYAITTMQEAQKMINDVFGTINILLLALTSISLLVGGVGIMNVMYVAVVERTFEIGLRKSVGARAADIRNQFLLEAVLITLMGGIVGIFLGYLIALGFSYVLSLLGFSLQFSVTFASIILATGFSTATGIIFGFYPAYKASKLSPMEALRKE
ncbi:MAG: Efflux ABC transporter, permease protein [Candidatus Moranbacteria bacterium GW2011_GWE1_36_7]|nr:MAG: Efflux ABC transporter, permease protein [Candidatus Moranbacteria bacterium GW2011_GWD2_36_12]KKQ06830.1 MAG: Efflux ABC transporter, permease protein [Candidatus Moranbacteria bacterium GW2011_GWE2_36_40]KKQ15420.1 MAG: Efflux ABC transporter, permease protein [Candidatus Moranbacteria bacterium GW2011_GWE1_36_7]